MTTRQVLGRIRGVASVGQRREIPIIGPSGGGHYASLTGAVASACSGRKKNVRTGFSRSYGWKATYNSASNANTLVMPQLITLALSRAAVRNGAKNQQCNEQDL